MRAPIPEIQPGRASIFHYDKKMRVGNLCVVGLTRQPAGQGRYQLDRIAKLKKGYGGREISVVESGLPIMLNRAAAWDGERHWFAYALDTAPGDIRARDLWDWWIAEGRPTWRWPSQAKAAVMQFIVKAAA